VIKGQKPTKMKFVKKESEAEKEGGRVREGGNQKTYTGRRGKRKWIYQKRLTAG
jgi:hypothetical protein